MNILMMTNTYLPFIGGVERSIEIFSNEFRKCGHRVKIVSPKFENIPEMEQDVIRVPALQHFNGTDFSVHLPIPGMLNNALKNFKPDIVHSHHPFMIGDSALRVAAQFRVPLVFTFHTYYERYTHYVPGDSAALKRFVIALATGYANLCDHVFAPSASVAAELLKRGVTTNIDIVPTGIELEMFASGDGASYRKKIGILSDKFVIGFVSRIAPEKNVEFLVKVVKEFMVKVPRAHFLVIGKGPLENNLKAAFSDESLINRVHLAGSLVGQELIDAYHAMDTFVFASQTETQGLVITEAMATGLPVVALDGPAVNEIVKDFKNGRLIFKEDVDLFCEALFWVEKMEKRKRSEIKKNAYASVIPYAKEQCAARALSIYLSLMQRRRYSSKEQTDSLWSKAKRMIKVELKLIKNMTRATGAAISEDKT